MVTNPLQLRPGAAPRARRRRSRSPAPTPPGQPAAHQHGHRGGVGDAGVHRGQQAEPGVGAYLNLGTTSQANYLTIATGSGYTALSADPIAFSGFSAGNLELPVFMLD